MPRPVRPTVRRRLPRHWRSRRPVSHQLTPRDRQLLAALAVYPLLTAAQLCCLVFGSLSALSYCRERLKRLYHAHLVDRLLLVHAPHGSPLTVYTTWRRTPPRRSLLFLEHTLAVMGFFIAVVMLGRTMHLVLDSVILERDLRRAPVRVELDGRAAPVIPDCYLRLILSGTYELAWCLELDRGSEPSRAIREKVDRYLAFAAGPYQASFGTTTLTVVIVTTAGARRLAHLIAAAEDALVACGRADQADLFRLTSADLARETPEAIFRAKRFWIPFQSEPVALIPEVAA